MQRWIGIGRLTKDVELRQTSSGTAVAGFTLAVDGYKDHTDFIPIVVWGKQAENCSQYLSKGKLAAVNGRMQVRSYEDSNGNKRVVTEVVAESVKFLSPKDKNQTEQTEQYEPPMLDEDLPF